MYDKRDVLQVLRTELAFLKLGGYSLHPSLGPELFFEDSPSCINCVSDDNVPCTECILSQFVPPERRNEAVACRHISLNVVGETLESLYRQGNRKTVGEAVGNWLQTTIERLEKEQGNSSAGRDNKEGSDDCQAILSLFSKE